MKRLLNVFMIIAISVFCISLTACNKGKKDESSNPSVMVMDINPSIEFVLDENNKVASVTALNDDGAIILSGEAIIGLSAEDAAKKVIQISIETGYLSKDDAKDITFTLGGTNADELYKELNNSVVKFVKDKGIDSQVKQGKELLEKDLKDLLLKADPTLTEEEINALNLNELLNKISESRNEYANLVTNELREAYLSFKNNKIEFAEKEETAAIIETLGSTYETVLATYKQSLVKIDEAIDAINDAYYNNLLDENSSYQKALKEVKAAKVKLVSVKNAKTAQELLTVITDESFKDVYGIDTIISSLNLAIAASQVAPEQVQTVYDSAHSSIMTALETLVEQAQTMLETAENLANEMVNTATTTLNNVKAELVNLEKEFPAEIKTALTNNVKELETAVNNAKDSALASFEEEYNKTIEAINKDIEEQKAALKAAVSK